MTHDSPPKKTPRHHRWHVIGLLLLLAGTLYLAATGTPQTTAAAIRPNIILIVADDQRPESLQHMPTVRNRLMPEAVVFDNAFATTPLCCPSRASLLTGRYAFRHGVLTNGGPLGGIDNFDDTITLATELKRQTNYTTHYIGRYLNGYYGTNSYIPPGWDDFQAIAQVYSLDYKAYLDYDLNDNGTTVYYGTTESDYSTDVLTARALDVINNQSGAAPFFLHLAYYAPHAPRLPAVRHEGTFTDLPPWNPPNYNEADISDKPAWFAELPPFDDARAQDVRLKAQQTLLAVDEGIAQILDAVEATGQLNNTVVIYTSDNGFSWGENRLISKTCPYEACLRVPLIVWSPGQTNGVRLGRPVLNIDIPATIADIAGLSYPTNRIDGKSLLQLADSGATWRTDFLFENWQNPGSDSGLAAIIPDYKGVWAGDWKYIEYINGEMELYDLANDPYEMNNVAYDPGHADILAALQTRLAELRPFDPPVTPAMSADYDNVVRCPNDDINHCRLQWDAFR